MTCLFRHIASFIAREHACLVTATLKRGMRKVCVIRQIRDGVSSPQHMVTNSCVRMGVGRLTGWGFSTTQQPSLCQNSLIFPDGSSFRPLPEAPGGSCLLLTNQSSHSGVATLCSLNQMGWEKAAILEASKESSGESQSLTQWGH